MNLFYYLGQTESSTELDSKGKRNLWTRTHLTREDILQTKNINKNSSNLKLSKLRKLYFKFQGGDKLKQISTIDYVADTNDKM